MQFAIDDTFGASQVASLCFHLFVRCSSELCLLCFQTGLRISQLSVNLQTGLTVLFFNFSRLLEHFHPSPTLQLCVSRPKCVVCQPMPNKIRGNKFVVKCSLNYSFDLC
jgi:hypothetical protein